MSDYQIVLFYPDDTSSFDIEGAKCAESAVIEAIAQFTKDLAKCFGYEDIKAAEQINEGYTTCVHLGDIDHIAAMCHADPKPHIFTMSHLTGPVEFWVKASSDE